MLPMQDLAFGQLQIVKDAACFERSSTSSVQNCGLSAHDELVDLNMFAFANQGEVGELATFSTSARRSVSTIFAKEHHPCTSI